MNKNSLLIAAGIGVLFASCKKDENTTVDTKPTYTVPTTYSFSTSSVNMQSATNRVKMVVELDAYLKKANTGATLVTLDAAVVNNMFTNTASPFSDASLNTSGISAMAATGDASLYKSYADSVLMFNTGATASAGVGGFVARGTNKIVVGPHGLEYGQAYVKGVMGAMAFKEAVRVLTAAKAIAVTDSVAAQKLWDEAFAYLAVPVNYDSSVVYASTDQAKPLLWGGYLAERGKSIQAGGTIFNAFLKGRAAIGGMDVTTRNEQADIIMAKWEQLAAAAALNYVTAPTASSAVGNAGTQLHALSEGFGFIYSFKYRSSNSKLSAADFDKLMSIINTDFYVLINQAGFADLVAAQNILKTTYGL